MNSGGAIIRTAVGRPPSSAGTDRPRRYAAPKVLALADRVGYRGLPASAQGSNARFDRVAVCGGGPALQKAIMDTQQLRLSGATVKQRKLARAEIKKLGLPGIVMMNEGSTLVISLPDSAMRVQVGDLLGELGLNPSEQS